EKMVTWGGKRTPPFGLLCKACDATFDVSKIVNGQIDRQNRKRPRNHFKRTPCQFLPESPNVRLRFRVTFRVGHQDANPPHLTGLLPPRRERPRGHRAAERRDEVAPPHVEHWASSHWPVSRPSGFITVNHSQHSHRAR